VRKCARAGIATGWAMVDISRSGRHGFRIRTATLEAALSALGLRQDAVEALDQFG
jgi:hypothetical protein